ncbi:unnamed protein product [Musa acuminata subsp. malaccensis]|uniref:(wild Malaysian banana) hypothetical protein n=1 Tax=Musa acuminata subsp. malaccensis TaxID=214687 RepID=A0A804HZS4_MUSAM|nr:unnamed protein product [Musa acuminata subsp. malaccensis]
MPLKGAAYTFMIPELTKTSAECWANRFIGVIRVVRLVLFHLLLVFLWVDPLTLILSL